MKTTGFVLPAALHLVVFKGRLPVWRLIANWSLLVFGAITAILVTVFAILKVVLFVCFVFTYDTTQTKPGCR
jgi:hypothetical protein